MASLKCEGLNLTWEGGQNLAKNCEEMHKSRNAYDICIQGAVKTPVWSCEE